MLNPTDVKNAISALNLQQKNDFPHSDVSQLLMQRTDFFDQLLLDLWRQYGLESDDVALIAVGGYGRKEMFPHSDLDILVLSAAPLDEARQQQINALFNFLWDCKLQVGAAIRTLDECLEIGKKEISVATNMYESRWLSGNKNLWQQLYARLFSDDFWQINDFYRAKIAEKESRYQRYHNTSYNLEPDLKHSPGGLRDLHLLSWIMLRHYGTYAFDALLNRGILFPEEYQELNHAQAVLFRMRFALHLQLKRYDNRLRFDRQLMLSELLGYQGDGNRPVETMMKSYFQATQSISQLTQLLLDSFADQVLNKANKPFSQAEKTVLDEHYFLQDHSIYCENRHIFKQHPHTILDLFFHLTQYPDAVANPTMLRHLRLSLHKLSAPLSQCEKSRHRFISLFSQPQMVKRAIVPMHRLGVLTAYLPQWSGIEGLMQFDLFHIYTVDEHTVRVMLKLESFLDPNSAENHPLCTALFPKLTERPLLYLAALFHDIAKGRDGDHAKVGALDMRAFAERHGFDETQIRYMEWLVAEHLTMSVTAQRRDIHDPQVVKTFAEIVKNQTALSSLMCLTIADICATNDNLWNDWKRSLFAQLYQFTLQQLDKELDYQKVSDEHRNQAIDLMKFALSADERQRLNHFWQPCPNDYFLRNSPKQLVWHALGYLKHSALPLVLVSNQNARGATEIFVHCHDQPQLFARIAQEISKKKMSIHNAQIITAANGLVYDSFIVTELNGEALSQERSKQIHCALQNILSDNGLAVFKPIKKPVKHSSFKRPTRIRFLPEQHRNQTAFELFTLDREGLLANIGYIFSQQKLVLLNAKITTNGERVEDFFTVSGETGLALTETEKENLENALLTELGN